MLLAVSAGKVIQRPAGSRPRPLRRPCCSRTLRSPVRPQRGPEPLAWEVPQRIWTRAEGRSQGIGVHSLPPVQRLRVKTEPASDSRFSCGWRWARGCCSLSPSPQATAPTGVGRSLVHTIASCWAPPWSSRIWFWERRAQNLCLEHSPTGDSRAPPAWSPCPRPFVPKEQNGKETMFFGCPLPWAGGVSEMMVFYFWLLFLSRCVVCCGATIDSSTR